MNININYKLKLKDEEDINKITKIRDEFAQKPNVDFYNFYVIEIKTIL